MDAYYILNDSKAAEITTAWLEKVRYALELQNHTDFCPMWESQPKEFFVAVDGNSIPKKGARVFHIVDSIPEAPDALAYHTIDADGRPVLRIGVDVVRTTGDLLAGLESGMSHEVCETEADPYVQWNADMPDGKSDTPIEVCDWTQGDTYTVAGCTMSNFCGPRFFNANETEGPFDHMGLCTKPFELRPGGYYVKRVGGPGGHQRQIFGEACPEHVRKHAAETSRAAMRMRKAAPAETT